MRRESSTYGPPTGRRDYRAPGSDGADAYGERMRELAGRAERYEECRARMMAERRS